MENKKLDKISEDVSELKVSVAVLDANQKAANAILDRLTESVEVHVKRTNALEELVQLTRDEHADFKRQQAEKTSFVKGAFWAVSGLLALTLSILALHK